jgi:hypothetical protein
LLRRFASRNDDRNELCRTSDFQALSSPAPFEPQHDMTESSAPDYSQTLFLPRTEFPMRAGLPQKEPELLARWRERDLYKRIRETSAGRPRFVLHDLSLIHI